MRNLFLDTNILVDLVCHREPYVQEAKRIFAYLKQTIMKTTSEYLQLLKQFKDSKAMQYGIRKIGLFGSVARGEHKEGSDVDVVYEGEPNILLRSRMKRELESLFECNVDLVRFRKQLENTLFGESIHEDLILV